MRRWPHTQPNFSYTYLKQLPLLSNFVVSLHGQVCINSMIILNSTVLCREEWVVFYITSNKTFRVPPIVIVSISMSSKNQKSRGWLFLHTHKTHHQLVSLSLVSQSFFSGTYLPSRNCIRRWRDSILGSKLSPELHICNWLMKLTQFRRSYEYFMRNFYWFIWFRPPEIRPM